ncbi:hypothetical protein [Bartonella tribocorum]|uniref:hypothetical protein n=1 Tax=Bartonella tribocorum TaxID=85701 RepID=UPI0015D550C0|nr:hypothetical protein [Bartonella tribocorum]
MWRVGDLIKNWMFTDWWLARDIEAILRVEFACRLSQRCFLRYGAMTAMYDSDLAR